MKTTQGHDCWWTSWFEQDTTGLLCRKTHKLMSKPTTSAKGSATSSENRPRNSPLWRPRSHAQWGLDIMGPFLVAVRQLKLLVVGINYFTKWVEVEALATIMEKNIQSFVWKNIICRYGIPKVLVSDNKKQFDNSTFRDLCSELGIKNHYSSPTHPQANG